MQFDGSTCNLGHELGYRTAYRFPVNSFEMSTENVLMRKELYLAGESRIPKIYAHIPWSKVQCQLISIIQDYTYQVPLIHIVLTRVSLPHFATPFSVLFSIRFDERRSVLQAPDIGSFVYSWKYDLSGPLCPTNCLLHFLLLLDRDHSGLTHTRWSPLPKPVISLEVGGEWSGFSPPGATWKRRPVLCLVVETVLRTLALDSMQELGSWTECREAKARMYDRALYLTRGDE